MSRQVWIVGEPAKAGSSASRPPYHRFAYHLSDCYVLDQEGNRDHRRAIDLDKLPESYGPCGHCAPGSRTALDPQSPPRPTTGIQPGHEVEFVDLVTDEVTTVRIAEAAEQRNPTETSPESPLGMALIGKESGAVVEVKRPRDLQRIRILSTKS